MIDQIVQQANLSLTSIEKLEAAAKAVSIPKGTTVLREGEVCKYLYLIEKGLMRIYYIDAKGRDISHWFSAENQIMSIPRSFFNQSASNYFIETLEDVEARK
ncbi:MAG: CRP-like cAMP-binding protein, partial [Chitinophagales bacterium]